MAKRCVGSQRLVSKISKRMRSMRPLIRLANPFPANVKRIFTTRNFGYLTVIVPTYNVELYLDDLLNSLREQHYTRFEVLIVDDGSTDGTREIARKYVSVDRRFRLIEVTHGGNGRARNIAIAQAKGDFIAFADGDDIVPPGAYAQLLSSLSRTGSDFAVGGYQRLIGTKVSVVSLSSALHARQHERITLKELPEIVDDVFLWNKIYRKSFWISQIGTIPENVLYEDQVTTARGYLRSTSFDVLTEDVYRWRLRADASSITQKKREIKNLEDRAAVMKDLTELLGLEGDPRVSAAVFQRLLGSDLTPYFELAHQLDDRYWDVLRGVASDLYQAAPDGILERLEVYERLLVLAALSGTKDDVETIVLDRIEQGKTFKIDSSADELRAQCTFLENLSFPVTGEQLLIQAGNVRLKTGILSARRIRNSSIEIHFYAFFEGLSGEPSDTVHLVGSKAFESLEPLKRGDPEIDLIAPDATTSHSNAGYVTRLPASLEGSKMDASLTSGRLKAGFSLRIPKVDHDKGNVFFVENVGLNAAKSSIVVRLQSQRTYADIVNSLIHFKLETSLFSMSGLLREVAGAPYHVDVELPLHWERWGSAVDTPPTGAYTFRVVASPDGKEISGAPVKVAEGFREPVEELSSDHALIRPYVTAGGRLAVRVSAPVGRAHRSRNGQRQLREEYVLSKAPLSDAWLFESYGGKVCTDSPRAISDELHASGFSGGILWSVVDRSVRIPHYATAVVHGSPEWYAALAESSVLVNNHNFPHFFRKRAGQFYLQTWHGTPLKKIGLDAPNHTISSSYRRVIKRESAQWDLLLAQNAYAAEKFTAAFDFTGEILVSGYPRNDALVHGDAQRRAAVRSLLGIKEHQTVLLYAPTWRDDAGKGRTNRMVGYIDAAEIESVFEDDVIVLSRGHHNTDGGATSLERNNVINVSDYPEINDLYMAADILVTDYSSTMFDFTVTLKPIIFLVPDYGNYTRTVRGLYLELSDIAPGPVVFRREDLVDVLREYFGAKPKENKKIEVFRSEFLGPEDGRAALRVINHVKTATAGVRSV